MVNLTNRTAQFIQYTELHGNHSHLRPNITILPNITAAHHFVNESGSDDNIVLPIVFLILFLFFFFDYMERLKRKMNLTPRPNLHDEKEKYAQNVWTPRYFQHYSPKTQRGEGFHAIRPDRPDRAGPDERGDEENIRMVGL